MPLEILHRALVLFGGGAAGKRAEIAAPAGLRIDFARKEPVFAGRQFTDHGVLRGSLRGRAEGASPQSITPAADKAFAATPHNRTNIMPPWRSCAAL